jgi:hypothetical protein
MMPTNTTSELRAIRGRSNSPYPRTALSSQSLRCLDPNTQLVVRVIVLGGYQTSWNRHVILDTGGSRGRRLLVLVVNAGLLVAIQLAGLPSSQTDWSGPYVQK